MIIKWFGTTFIKLLGRTSAVSLCRSTYNTALTITGQLLFIILQRNNTLNEIKSDVNL